MLGSHELVGSPISQVPQSTEAIYSIGNCDPPAMLCYALERYEKGDVCAQESLRLIIITTRIVITILMTIIIFIMIIMMIMMILIVNNNDNSNNDDSRLIKEDLSDAVATCVDAAQSSESKHISLSLSIYLYISLSLYLSLYIYIYTHTYIHTYMYMPIYLSVYLSTYPSIQRRHITSRTAARGTSTTPAPWSPS